MGSLQRYPKPPSWIYGGLFLRERRGGRTREKGKGGERREGRGPTSNARGMRGEGGKERGEVSPQT